MLRSYWDKLEMIKFWAPTFPRNGSRQMGDIFGWRFSIHCRWHFSRVTKFGTITRQDQWKVFRGQTTPPKGARPQRPKNFHTGDLYAPVVVADHSCWRAIFRRRILGVDPAPIQGDEAPQNPYFWNIPHSCAITVEPRVTKFDTLTRQGRTINTHRPLHLTPKGVGPKPQFFYSRSNYIQLFGRILQYLSGWLTRTNYRRHSRLYLFKGLVFWGLCRGYAVCWGLSSYFCSEVSQLIIAKDVAVF